jgi:hypothetical protein
MAADAVSSITSPDIIAVFIYVAISVAVSGLLCFLFYKLVAGKLDNHRRQNRVDSVPAAHKPASGQLISERVVAGEPEKPNPWLTDWVRQTEELSRQRAQESNRRALADIITLARREIGRERDRAVFEMKREYEELVALSGCK